MVDLANVYPAGLPSVHRTFGFDSFVIRHYLCIVWILALEYGLCRSSSGFRVYWLTHVFPSIVYFYFPE